jgi:hypothetical protein
MICYASVVLFVSLAAASEDFGRFSEAASSTPTDRGLVSPAEGVAGCVKKSLKVVTYTAPTALRAVARPEKSLDDYRWLLAERLPTGCGDAC